jgi:hypothetical protein
VTSDEPGSAGDEVPHRERIWAEARGRAGARGRRVASTPTLPSPEKASGGDR